MTARQQGQGLAPAGIARCSKCGHGTPTKGRKRMPWGWLNACCQRQVPLVVQESETPPGKGGVSSTAGLSERKPR